MNGQWMMYVVFGLFLVYRILAILKDKDAQWWFSVPSRDPWTVAGRLSVVALAVGLFLVTILQSADDAGKFLLAFYPVRFWCVLIAVLMGVIFWLGSKIEQRVAGVAGVLVFGGWKCTRS